MEPMLVLVCGLPGAGKSTLVARLVAESADESRMFGRITFDDLFQQWREQAEADLDVEFDPIQWKECQGEMATRVRTSLAQWRQQQAAAGRKDRQLVLLVDDNFPYRSQRKRFFQLAADGKCLSHHFRIGELLVMLDAGFGVLYVNTAVAVCWERNARRRDAIDSVGGGFVPDHVFERMVQAFEPPDASRAPWERNTRQLFQSNGVDLSEPYEEPLQVAQTVLASIATEAARALTHQREERASGDRKRVQQSRDQARVHADVAHLVDLQLRQWIASELGALDTASDKAQRAQLLNGRRKRFLVELKAAQASARGIDGAKDGDANGTGSDAGNGQQPKRLLQLVASPTRLKSSDESGRGLVDALVAFFRSEHVGCELSSPSE